MTSKLRLVLAVALTVFVLDHVTKWLIVRHLAFGDEITVIAGFFDIIHTRNMGAAFGIFSSWQSPFRDWFFYGIGMVAIVFLYQYVKATPEKDRTSLLALAFILGGALGNLTDRMLRGSVVDFLSVHYYNQVASWTIFGKTYAIPLTWPAFNVADSAICVGVTLLLIQSFRGASGGKKLES